ncbi:MAG: hypothetical protein DI536_04260 [Archangium gephyra]|uniref:GGDEF domain-containing protein n=1 Tax=Archangium gephyra TaxID=48 RepID=A0A2W5TW68_9BACT|nr:MAG: hypothetical protein DI536_04260 [Archangium gephyra]
MSLTDEQLTRFEGLSGKTELDDAEMTELEQLDGLSRQPDIAAPAPQPWLTTSDVAGGGDQQSADEDLVNGVFKAGLTTSEGEAADALRIAKQLGVPSSTVRAALPDFRKTAEAANFDARRWMTENPMLFGVLFRNPEVGPLITRDKKLSVVTQAFLNAVDVAPGVFGGGIEYVADLKDQWQAILGGEEAMKARRDEQKARIAQRAAGRPVQEIDDATAREAAGNPLAVASLRAQETAAQMQVSRIGTRIMLARRSGEDTTQLESELYDAQLRARPRALGEGAAMQVLTDAVQGVTSSLSMLGGGAEGAVKGAAVGATVGAVATRSPAGARAGATAGARVGSLLGAGVETMDVETGSTYLELRDVRMDNGETLPEEVAFGAAVFAGAAKTVVELAEFELQKKAFEPVAAALRSGNRVPLMQALRSSADFRAKMAQLAQQWGPGVKAGVGEAFEEGAQTAIEEGTKYLAEAVGQGALPERAPVNMENVREAMGTALPAGFVFAGAGPSFSMLESAVTLRRSEKAQLQVPLLMEMAEQPAFQAAPEALAAAVQEETATTTEPISAVHVDASAIVRFFQEQGLDGAAANRTVTELLGEGAPTRLLEAAAAGGKLEVPLEALPAWSGSELGKQLVDDTTTDAGLMTPRQLRESGAEIEEEARRIATEELVQFEDRQLLDDRTRALEQQLVAAGQTPNAARAGAAVVRAFVETQAADFDQTVSQVFPETPVSVAAGDEQATTNDTRLDQTEEAPSASRALTERFNAQVGERAEERVTDFFIDTTTGALNKRAFERIEPAGRQVAVISVEGIKYQNDNLGHDAGNAVYRAAAQALAPYLPEVAKVGGDFAVYVDNQEQLDAALERANQAGVLEGYTLTGTAGADLRAAAKANNEKKKAAETAGQRAGRGERPRGAAPLAAGQAVTPLAGQRLEGTVISPALRERLATEFAGRPAAQFDATYIEAATGLLTKDGFDRVPPKRFKASIDLNGIKEFNDVIGEETTDRIIEAFGNALREAGGADFDAAHISGDEFMAQADDEGALRAWLQQAFDAIEQRLEIPFEATPEQREFLKVPEGQELMIGGLIFGAGVGESVDDAERALNADKQRLSAEGKRGPGRAVSRVVGRPATNEGRGPGNREGDRRSPSSGRQRLVEVTRLEQDTSGHVPKGYTETPAGRALQSTIRVFLNKSADASTVIHESAHAFLEQLGDLAQRADAPQRTRDTYAAALKALGVTERREVKREHHEKFARGFEAYVMEGKAPQAGLKRAFTRFSRWLTGIYRSIRGIPGVELNDDLRNVFDAMLATENQLQAMRRRQGPVLQAEQVGVTPEQRREQLEQEADDYTEGSYRAQLRAVKDALRVREAWWRKGLKQLETAFGDEFEELPAVRAQRLLQGALTGTPVLLNRAAVQEVIGDLRVPGLRTTEEGGARPAEIAELAGFRSGTEMLASMAAVLPQGKEAWVKRHAEAEMRRLHPALVDDLKRFRALLAGGLQEATVKRLEREVTGLPREASKRAARMLVDRREVRALKPSQALALQRAAAQRKARAMAAGDIAATRAAAEQELLNQYLHTELSKAVVEVERFSELAASLRKVSARERLGKASPAYRDAIDFLQGALGLAEATNADVGALTAAVARLNGDAVIVGDPDWLQPVQRALERVESVGQLTVAELGAVRDAMVMIRQGARNRTTMLLDDKRVDFDTVKADVLREISEVLPRRDPLQAQGSATIGEKLAAGVNGIDGYLLSPVDMVRDLTGDNQNTALWRAIVNPMRRAEYFEADLMRSAVAPIVEAFDSMPDDVRAGLSDVIDGRALFPSHIDRFVPRRRGELLALALNAGNESNMKVLTEGRRITEQQVVDALNLLTKSEIDTVNAIMKAVESLREPAFALEERQTGLRPKAVEGRPIALANGTLEGGYFPLKAERFGGRVAEVQENEPGGARFVTAHGHLKSRTGATYPVTLDLNVMRRHLATVTHDIAFREPIRSVAQLVRDPEVNEALQDHLGAQKAAEFVQWLTDVSGASGLGSNVAEDIFGWLKGNMATALLSGPSTAIGNLANIAAAFTSTKLKAKHMAAGLLELATNPTAAKARAFESSGALRSMDDEVVKGLQQHVASLYAGRAVRGLEWAKEMGMVAMRTIDGITSTAVWLGAERQALAEGKTADEARRWADDILHQVQPSSSPVEKARILRDPGVIGKMSQFYGYLSVAYRAQHRLAAPLFTQEFQNAGVARKAVIAGGVAGNLFGFYVAFSVLGELLMGRGPEDGDRDEEQPGDELLKWRNWFVRKMVVAPLSTVPVVPLSGLVEGVVLGKKVNPRADPMTGALIQFADTGKAIMKAIGEDAPDGAEAKAAKQFARSMSLVTGFPYRALDPTLPYIWDITAGDRAVPNAGRFVGGVLYGERDNQPANIPAAVGDVFTE